MQSDVSRQNGIVQSLGEGFLRDRGQNAVHLDRGRADIGQHREGNAVLIAEGFQNLGRVVADGGQSETLIAKLFDLALQLDQLRPAVGSPIRRLLTPQGPTPLRTRAAQLVVACGRPARPGGPHGEDHRPFADPLNSSRTLRAVRRRETVFRGKDDHSPRKVQNVRKDSTV